MNKDGTGPSSSFIKERRRKKTGKERKVENESFSADIHDAFCSFMLRCSSLFHLSKSLRNKNEAKLLRYSYSFHPTEGFALAHIGWDVTPSHRLRCSVSYNATLTQNNNNPQVWVSRARTDLKRKHNHKGISNHSATQIYRWSLQQRWIRHLQTTRFKHNRRLLIYFYHYQFL